MRIRVRVGAVAAAALLSLTAACAGGDDGSGGSTTGAAATTVRIGTATEVPRINPANDNGATGIGIAHAMWSPLTQTDPATGKLAYVAAASVTSKNAKVWTITLRPGWTFQNGEKVTAKSYIDTWNYTAYAPHAFANNGFFNRVQGYDAMNPTVADGKTPPAPKAKTLSGLKQIDDLTFQVTLKYAFSPYPTTLQYLGAAPLAPSVLKDPGSFDHKPIGNGPYQLDGDWKTGSPIKLKRYDAWPGTDKPSAAKIEYDWYSNPETAYNDFLAGNLDFVSVPSSKVASAKSDSPDGYAEGKSTGSVSYVAFPLWDKQYDNVDLRQALSLALDRGSLAKLVGIATPAVGYTTNSLDGYRDDACAACTLDVAKAKDLLAKAGGFDGKLKIYFSSESPTSQAYAQAVGNMWRQNLGIEVQYVPKTASEISGLATTKKLDGIRFTGWGYDYPSIEDMLTPMFASYGDANFSGYASKAVDAALQKASSEADPHKSIAGFQGVEDLVYKDLPLIPVYNGTTVYLHSTGVVPRNTAFSGVDPVWSTLS